MKFNFNEKKLAVDDGIREYAKKKIGKLDKYLKQEGTAQVTFAKVGDKNHTEITVVTDNLTLRASASAYDLYGALDGCVAGMERQIHKHKTRLAKKLRDGAFIRESPPVTEEIDVPEETDFPIIRRKHIAVKPMTPEEAILQMNLLDHNFFVFKNFESKDAFSVVYKRKDGGYGLIDEG